MTEGDVETRVKRGQWVNRVAGKESLSQSFSSREEAIDAGRKLAEELGTTHTVLDSDPTGVITDSGEEGGEVAVEPG